MVKSYRVKQKKQTECVEPSGYKTTKNGRLMFFCTCAECGIKKTKFVKSKSTGGAIGGNTKPYCGIGKVPKGKHLGTMAECFDSGQIRHYGKKKVNKNILNTLTESKKEAKKIIYSNKKKSTKKQ